MVELKEVAADAAALAAELAKANRLPADFPVEQLLELLVGCSRCRAAPPKVAGSRSNIPVRGCPRSGGSSS